MKTLVIWFEDATACPERVAPASAASGLRREWFDALTAGLSVHARRGTEQIVTSVRLDVPVHLAEHFAEVLSKACLLLGTIAWIRDHSESQYAEAWERNQPLFSAPAEATV